MANVNELEALYNNYQQDSSLQDSLGKLYESYNPVEEVSRPLSARVGDIGYDLAGRVEMLGKKYRDLRKKAEATKATSAPMPEPWNVLGEEKKLLLDIAKPVPALTAAGGAEALAGGARFFGSDDFANEMTESAKAVRAQIQKELPVEEGSLDEALRGALTSIYTIAPGLISGTGFALLGREATIPMIKAGTLASMGAQSAGQTLNEQLIGGSDRLTAATAATVNAAAEVIPEMLSWNILFGKGTAIGKRAAQLYLSEILGENATTATNLATQKFTIKPDMTSEEVIEALKDTTRQTILMTSILQAPNVAIGMHNRGLAEDNAKLKEIVETDQEAAATKAAEVTSLTEEEEAEARRLASLALRETAIPTPKPEDVADALGVLRTTAAEEVTPVEETLSEEPTTTPALTVPEDPVTSIDIELPENKLSEEANAQLDKVLEPIEDTVVEEPTPLIETPVEPAPTPKSYVPIVNMQNPLDNSVDYTESGAARLVVDGPAGTQATAENVKTIIIDPDGFEPGEMISGIRGIVEGLKAQFPKATFSVVDSRGDEAPVEIFKAKSIGNSNLAKIKKIFGATEDINPRAKRANVSPEEKVARLLLKDKKATAELAKTHPEMVNKLIKDAGRGGELTSTVVGVKAKPAIEPGVWYRGIKDGATVINQDLSKIESELGAGALIEKGTLDGTSFTPKEVVQKEESVLTKIIRNMPPVGLSTKNVGPALFNKAESVINDKVGRRIKGDDLYKLLKANGASDDELSWFESVRDKEFVSKQEVLDTIKASKIQFEDVILGPQDGSISEGILAGTEVPVTNTQFSSYQLPGGKNYREMFVTAPFINNVEQLNKAAQRLFGKEFKELTSEDQKATEQYRDSFYPDINDWKDGHSAYSSIQNPVVRIRFNERSVEGKRILFIEEMQGPSDAEQSKMPDYLRKRIYEIGVKRILAYAKANGFDSVAWTTGEQQAERYDLSKQISRVEYWPDDNTLYAVDLNGNGVLNKTVEPDKVQDYIGKDLAKKLLAPETAAGRDAHVLEGIDIKVGGEGLKSLYDRVLPNLFKKFGKERPVNLPIVPRAISSHVADILDQMNAPSTTPEEYTRLFNTLSAAEKEQLRRGLEGDLNEDVQAIPITSKTPFTFPIGLSTQTPEQILAAQEAKAKLADAMLTLIRQAAGRPVDEFATQQGFTPEQITAMKDAVRGFIADSDELKIERQNKKKGVRQLTTTQKAQIVRKELKMSDKDWEAFKLASVGKASMSKTADNPMTAEEKKKVLNDLLALYEEKQGEKYSFKNKSDEDLEVSIALKQIVGLSDRELSRKELFEKVLRTSVMTGRYDLRKTKAGSVLAKILDRIISESSIETGGLLDPLRKVSKHIQDNNERLSKLLIEAEKAEVGWDKFLATLKGKDLEAMRAYKQLMNTIQQMAINREIEVTTVEMEGGKVKLTKEPFPTDMNKIHFPHMLVDQRDELSAKNHEKAIRSLMQPTAKNPEGRTAREAAQLLDAIRKSKKGMIRDPYLEYARQYDVDGFNTNILEVATLYAARAVKRMYTIDYFGFDQRKIDTLITQHTEQGGDRSVAEYVASQVLGTRQMDSKLWMRQIANAAVGFEVISKMGPFSALAQLGQLGFIYEETDIKTMVRTAARFLRGATREEAISFGYRSGAALGSIIKEFQDYIRNDTLVDKYLAASGFTPLDRFARITAATAGREYVTDLFEKVKRNPNKSGSAKARLRQFGIDAEKVLSENRELSDEELRFAGLQMSEKTQYRGGALNLPPWVTPTPVIRMLTLFHQFSYHRVRTMVDRFNENPAHFAKRLIPSLLSATAFGAMGSEIRRLFTGKERPDEWWKLWFEYLVMGGWFGMANDAIQAVFRSSQGLLSYVAGPVASDIATAFYDGARAVAGNVKGLLKDSLDVATYGAARVNPALGVGVGLAGKTIKGRVLTGRRD